MRKVTVVTICLNEGERLEKTLQSIHRQTYSNVEHVLIDGGSDGVTKVILDRYQDKFDYFLSEKDSGIYNAQNKGLLNSTGDFVIFLNGGDYFFNNNSIEILVNALLPGDEMVLGGLVELQGGSGEKTFHKLPKNIGLDFMLNASVWHPSAMISRELLMRKGGYREDLKICSDYAFFLETLCVDCVQLTVVDQYISCFWNDGISNSIKHSALRNSERARIQSELFPKSVLDLNQKYTRITSLLMPLIKVYRFLKRVKCLKR